MKKTFYVLALASLCLTHPLIAQEAAFKESSLSQKEVSTQPISADPFDNPQIIEIQKLHTQAEEGDKEATQKLVSQLETLTAQNPNNKLLLCYLGSAYTLASRDAFVGPNKLKLLKKGVQTMDEAVNAAPRDSSVRMVRAINNLMLPAFVGRRDEARADFQLLLTTIEKDPQIQHLNQRTRQAIYYFAGLSFRQLKEADRAQATWAKGLEIDKESDLAKKIMLEMGKNRRAARPTLASKKQSSVQS